MKKFEIAIGKNVQLEYWFPKYRTQRMDYTAEEVAKAIFTVEDAFDSFKLYDTEEEARKEFEAFKPRTWMEWGGHGEMVAYADVAVLSECECEEEDGEVEVVESTVIDVKSADAPVINGEDDE